MKFQAYARIGILSISKIGTGLTKCEETRGSSIRVKYYIRGSYQKSGKHKSGRAEVNRDTFDMISEQKGCAPKFVFFCYERGHAKESFRRFQRKIFFNFFQPLNQDVKTNCDTK